MDKQPPSSIVIKYPNLKTHKREIEVEVEIMPTEDTRILDYLLKTVSDTTD